MGVKYPPTLSLKDNVTMTYYEGGSCHNPGPHISYIELENRRRGFYEREQRPKPTVLIGSPTSRDYISSTKRKRGRVEYRKSRRIACGPSGDFQQEYQAIIAGYPTITAVPGLVDVMLALRLEVLKLKVNLSQDVPEFKRTVKSFVGGVSTIVKARKAAYWKKKRNPRDPANWYLASTYGVEPAVGTMVSALQQLRAPNTHANSYRRVYTSKTSKASVIFKDDSRNESCEAVNTFKAVMYVSINQPNYQFSVGNPATWVWELIPYSFVVDWFIDVGSTLQGLSALSGFTVELPPVVSERQKKTSTGSITIKGNGQPWNENATSAGSLEEIESYRRYVGSSKVPMSLLPQVGNGVVGRRITNAIALLTANRRPV